MSGNRYFSETTSELTFRRVADAPDTVNTETKSRLLEEAKAANLSEELLKIMERELNAREKTEDKLSPSEVEKIQERIRLLDMVYYGVQVNENGIFFEGTQEGNLYDPAVDLTVIFDSVRDTVRFDGVVEVWAIDVENYTRLEIKDSFVVATKAAKITWV